MEEDLRKSLKVLKEGGIILYPTDTVWGLGCDATNEAAVKRIFEIKGRHESKSMLVLTDNEAKIQRLTDNVPDVAWDLIQLSDKPLTIIYSDVKNLASSLIAPDGSAGIRVTKEEFSRKLCERFRAPIVSTSANTSEQPSPQNFGEISDEIKNAVDYVVSYRQEELTKATPSSIIKLEPNGVITIIRE